MPGNAVGPVVKEGLETLIFRATVNQVNFRIVLRSARGWMDVQAAKISAILESFLDGQLGKVLVSKCDDLLLGYEQSELILSSVGELGQLNAGDLGAYRRGDVLNMSSILQKVLERWIRILAVLNVFERLEGRISVVSVSAKDMRRAVGAECGEVLEVANDTTPCGREGSRHHDTNPSHEPGLTYFTPFSFSHVGR